MSIQETTELSVGRVTEAVLRLVQQISYPGEILTWPPIACGNKLGVWLVVVCWEKSDRRGNRFSQVIVFLVWGDADGAVQIRPYHQEGPCVSCSVTSFIYFPDHDGKIHIQLSIDRMTVAAIEPPWMEE